jgi:uncharacterized protein with PQ loop repeat
MRKRRRIRKKVEKRQREIKLRKNFFPTLFLALMLWVIIAYLLYFVDPYSFGALPLLLICLYFSLFFTFTIIFANKRRGAIFSTSIVLFLVMRYFGVGHIVNLVLLSALSLTIEYYFTRSG